MNEQEEQYLNLYKYDVRALKPHHYGGERADHLADLAAQKDKCAICGIGPLFYNGGKHRVAAHLDHCHQTDEFRGWLCARCNHGLGHFMDNPEFLRAAAAYIERHRAKSPIWQYVKKIVR